jgi:hypothetical protein
LAKALAAAGNQFVFNAGWPCTADAARVLRVPSTFNKKYDPPRLVEVDGDQQYLTYTVERLWRALGPSRGAAPVTHTSNLWPFEEEPKDAAGNVTSIQESIGERRAPLRNWQTAEKLWLKIKKQTDCRPGSARYLHRARRQSSRCGPSRCGLRNGQWRQHDP